MNITIRLMGKSDRVAWSDMRAALWPEETFADHAGEIDVILGDEDYWGFVAENADGAPVGFAEAALRKYANGCDSRPVPFLEGIWVREEFRRRGMGKRLIGHVTEFFAARGFSEIGSDSYLDDANAQAAHLGWGFREMERVVYFRKILKRRPAEAQSSTGPHQPGR